MVESNGCQAPNFGAVSWGATSWARVGPLRPTVPPVPLFSHSLALAPARSSLLRLEPSQLSLGTAFALFAAGPNGVGRGRTRWAPAKRPGPLR